MLALGVLSMGTNPCVILNDALSVSRNNLCYLNAGSRTSLELGALPESWHTIEHHAV